MGKSMKKTRATPEFRSVMHFPKTQSRLIGNHPPFKRGRLLRDAGLETSHSKRLVYSNFGNRRSLSGQRAFLQVG